MLSSHGFKPARDKHAIFNGKVSRTIMRINVNEHLTITPQERRQVRAMVHQLGLRIRSGEDNPEVRQLLLSVTGKVGRLQRLHPDEASRLRAQTHRMQELLDVQPFQAIQEVPLVAAHMPDACSRGN